MYCLNQQTLNDNYDHQMGPVPEILMNHLFTSIYHNLIIYLLLSISQLREKNATTNAILKRARTEINTEQNEQVIK